VQTDTLGGVECLQESENTRPFKEIATGDKLRCNTETLLDASKEVGLEVNAEKTRYMFMSRHQTAG
jgi:hypothetical protein